MPHRLAAELLIGFPRRAWEPGTTDYPVSTSAEFAMTLPSIPPNAYTDAPEQHPNFILGSLQLLFWLFFRPTAWRNHIARIDPTLRPDFCWSELSMEQWRNPTLRQLLLQSHLVLPLLIGVLVGLIWWGLGLSGETIVYSVASAWQAVWRSAWCSAWRAMCWSVWRQRISRCGSHRVRRCSRQCGVQRGARPGVQRDARRSRRHSRQHSQSKNNLFPDSANRWNYSRSLNRHRGGRRGEWRGGHGGWRRVIPSWCNSFALRLWH